MGANVTVEDIRAYILVRQPNLSMDDRKKIITENHGNPTYETARKGLRLLGAKFFNELQQNQSGKNWKTYDCNYIENEEEEVLMTEEGDYGEWDEEWVYQALLEEGDEHAQFCHEFEEQIMPTCQESSELSSCFITYQEARQKIKDKARSRGFQLEQGKREKESPRRSSKPTKALLTPRSAWRTE